jgi:hypothetical protein
MIVENAARMHLATMLRVIAAPSLTTGALLRLWTPDIMNVRIVVLKSPPQRKVNFVTLRVSSASPGTNLSDFGGS